MLERTDVLSTIIYAIIFELFVYANFAGISLILYGLFGILGYKIPLNFRQPFSSTNVIDYWKGWHISLSLVLKALFYNPTRKFFSSTIALFVVFIASALWHGISLNFLIWGFLHALIFVISIKLLKNNNRILPFILFLIGVIIGRLIFSDSNSDRLLEKLMFSYQDYSIFNEIMSLPSTTKLALLLGISLIFTEFVFQNNNFIKKRNYKFLRTPLALVALTLITIIFINNIGIEFAVYGQR